MRRLILGLMITAAAFGCDGRSLRTINIGQSKVGESKSIAPDGKQTGPIRVYFTTPDRGPSR